MEKEGLIREMTPLRARNLEVSLFVTDRHRGCKMDER